ncbi:DUF2493 domain-containing protein [Methylobacterium sp. 1973]|uniref:DUF2493 domain-containing protein n=1 Tax=Methylobacterium sp. 1973 TaxID=3156421 RepID=UPI0033928649
MRVLICGGRYYGMIPKGTPRHTWEWRNAARQAEEERAFLFAALAKFDSLRGIQLVIHGAASGADGMAAEWAADNGIEVRAFPADWQDTSHPDARIKTLPNGRRYDANAGPRRNRRMLREGQPDVVIAFKGGKGTADMIAAATEAGVEVLAPEKVVYLTES